ncbi:hypothetical protein [Mesomycoplasma conjunctivae]|uniref:hypothetical protein n=1 Tax=Mesomycoplasma conjunctivae TaxID=45361 RepID=UPI003DA25B49
MKKMLLISSLAALPTITIVSCGQAQLGFQNENDVNKNQDFKDKVEIAFNDFQLEINKDKNKNLTYNQFKTEFENLFAEQKAKQNQDYPFACQEFSSKCLSDPEINDLVIRKLANKKTLLFSSKKGRPIPWNDNSVNFINWDKKWDDNDKKVELTLRFGHYHSQLQKHTTGIQKFSLVFDE